MLYAEDLSLGGQPGANTPEAAIAFPVSSLAQAFQATTRRNPLLKSYAHTLAALDGTVAQAGAIPNPDLFLQPENFGGTLSGFTHAETIIALSQLIETGGKRDRREQAALAEKELARVKAALGRIQLLAEMGKAYADVLAGQAAVTLAREQAAIAKEFLAGVEEKLQAGSILPVERTKAEILVQNAGLEVGKAERALVSARRSLAAYWQGSEADVGLLPADLKPISPKLVIDEKRIEDSLSFREVYLEEAAAESKVDLEKANAVQDVTVMLGYRRLQESKNNTMVGELSIPLPLFNRNRGGILNAQQELLAAKQRSLNAKMQLMAQAKSLAADLASLVEEEAVIKASVLPKAAQALSESRQAYRLGRVGSLEMLDVQRTMSETKKHEQDVLLSIRDKSLDLETLLAPDVGDAGPEPNMPPEEK